MEKDFKQIVALIVIGAIGIAIICVGLSFLLPALGVAAGLAWSIGTTGSAVGISVTPIVVSAAGYGLAGAGLASATYVVVHITKQVQKEPFRWLLPVLGVFNGLLVQICSDYWEGPKLVWTGIAAISALLVVVGGVLYSYQSRSLMVLGFLLHLFIPLVVVLCITSNSSSSIHAAIQVVPVRAWLLLGLMAFLALAIAILAKLLGRSH